jgi:hypothetical protein
MTTSILSLGDEGGSHLQSLSLLLLNAGKTVLGSLASLGVGHTENVVSFDSAVDTGVAGDRLAEHQALGSLLNAVEGSDGLRFLLVTSVGLGLAGVRFTGGVGDLGIFATEESVHGCWGNWLRIARLSSLDSNDLSNGLVVDGGMINELLLHHGGVF